MFGLSDPSSFRASFFLRLNKTMSPVYDTFVDFRKPKWSKRHKSAIHSLRVFKLIIKNNNVANVMDIYISTITRTTCNFKRSLFIEPL